MRVGLYSFPRHSPSASVRGWTDPSKLDSPAYPHDFQVSEGVGQVQVNLISSSQSGPNQGSDGGSTPHNESFQPPSEGASSTSSGEKPGRPPFWCTLCSRRPFAQKQGLMRHHREKHQPNLGCSHPDCDFKWTQSRRSNYRKHLRLRHTLEDEKIDEILGVPLRLCHRKGRVIESDLPPQFSPPIERDRQSPAEPQQRLLSPPAIPSVTYKPQLGHAESEVASTEREDSPSELEIYAATHAPSALLSEEDFSWLVRYRKIHGRFRFPSVHPGESTTPDVPPKPGVLHIPLPSPVGGYHTSPVSGDPSLPWTYAASN